MVLIFPGQGSQSVGMGKFLFDNFAVAKQVFEEASDSLKIDLKKLCFNASEADLALTENTQPALLVTSTAVQKVLRSEFNLPIEAVAGHSIGEYAAMVCAESIRFSDAVRAVRTRGQAMQSAVPVGEGGMLAIMGLNPAEVTTLCNWSVSEYKKAGFQGVFSPANFNCPGQVVASGNQALIDWLKVNFSAEKVFGENGPKKIRMIPLQVSAPFHCELMKPAEKVMSQVLLDMPFQNAVYPVLQNFTGKFHTEASTLRENLIRQVSAPVLWMQSMELMKEQGLTQFIECGSGSVLKGLLKKIDSEAFQVFNTTSLEEINAIGRALA